MMNSLFGSLIAIRYESKQLLIELAVFVDGLLIVDSDCLVNIPILVHVASVDTWSKGML